MIFWSSYNFVESKKALKGFENNTKPISKYARKCPITKIENSGLKNLEKNFRDFRRVRVFELAACYHWILFRSSLCWHSFYYFEENISNHPAQNSKQIFLVQNLLQNIPQSFKFLLRVKARYGLMKNKVICTLVWDFTPGKSDYWVCVRAALELKPLN